VFTTGWGVVVYSLFGRVLAGGWRHLVVGRGRESNFLKGLGRWAPFGEREKKTRDVEVICGH